jgi:hypothetical protein
MKAVMGARGVKIQLLCFFVQIWIDQKRCHCWQRASGMRSNCRTYAYRHNTNAWTTCVLFMGFHTSEFYMQRALMSTVTNMATVEHFEIVIDNLAYPEFVFMEITHSTGLLKLYEVFPEFFILTYLFYQCT